MRFNVHGDLASGVGNSANAKWLLGESAGPIHPDFALDGGEWLDADTILSRYNAITRLVISTRASGWVPQDFAAVANEFRAGGGNWAATLQVGEYSTFGSHRGQPLPARVSTRAGVIDAARDGSLLFQDFDSHVLVLWADGRLEDLGVAAPYPSLTESGVFMVTAGGVVVVRSNGDVHTCHLLNTAGLHKGLVCGDWIAYAADGIGRVLHRYDDPTQGYRLSAGWSPDMVMLGGQLHAAVSLGPAELPWELLREAPITLGEGMVPLGLPPPAVPVFEPTDEAIGIGVFQEPAAPALTIVQLDGTIDPRYPITSETEAVFCDATGNIEGSRTVAADLKVPALYYLDAYGLTPEMVPEGFRPALFAYPQAGRPIEETLELAEADMARMHGAGMPFDLVVAGYCQFRAPGDYALTEAQVLDTLGALWPMALHWGAGAWWVFHHGRYYDNALVDGVSYWPSISEAVRRVREASGNWLEFPAVSEPEPPTPEPPKPEPPKPEPPKPEPPEPPEPEEPVAAIKKIVLRREAEQHLYMSFQDNRTEVDARLTDPADARTWLEVTVYDQPGVEAPGKFAFGNKIVIRSQEDQVCVYPEQAPSGGATMAPGRPATSPPKKKQLHMPPTFPDPQRPDPPAPAALGVKANLNLAGMWDLRPGEFPNTAQIGVAGSPLAIYVTEDRQLELRDPADPANLKSRFDWKALSVDEQGKTAELTIPF